MWWCEVSWNVHYFKQIIWLIILFCFDLVSVSSIMRYGKLQIENIVTRQLLYQVPLFIGKNSAVIYISLLNQNNWYSGTTWGERWTGYNWNHRLQWKHPRGSSGKCNYIYDLSLEIIFLTCIKLNKLGPLLSHHKPKYPIPIFCQSNSELWLKIRIYKKLHEIQYDCSHWIDFTII